MPNEMKLGYITPIYKKGDRRNCSNYQGICVTNPIMKILGRLIRNQLELQFKGMEEQCGFTSGRSAKEFCRDVVCPPHHLKFLWRQV
jgi:hypothetical protein